MVWGYAVIPNASIDGGSKIVGELEKSLNLSKPMIAKTKIRATKRFYLLDYDMRWKMMMIMILMIEKEEMMMRAQEEAEGLEMWVNRGGNGQLFKAVAPGRE